MQTYSYLLQGGLKKHRCCVEGSEGTGRVCLRAPVHFEKLVGSLTACWHRGKYSGRTSYTFFTLKLSWSKPGTTSVATIQRQRVQPHRVVRRVTVLAHPSCPSPINPLFSPCNTTPHSIRPEDPVPCAKVLRGELLLL